MASHQNDAVFPEEDLDDDDETLEDEEEEDEDDDVLCEPDEDDETEPSPSTSSALAVVALAAPGSAVSEADNVTIPTATIAVADSSPKRQRTEQIEEKKALDDSRRLFQRLWTDEDEIGLLQGFLEYTAQRGSSHHNDTALFYDQIKSKLQLGFNKNQLVEKLRRLKKKYRNVLTKITSGKDFSFKSPHDQATFEISCRIWSNTGPITGPVEDDDEINLNPNPNPNFSHSMKSESMNEKRTASSRKRSRSRSEKRDMNDGSALHKDNNCNSNNNNNNNNNKDNENCNGRHTLQGLIEETVRGCLSPVLKELLVSGGMGFRNPFGFGGRGGFALNPMPMPMPMPLSLLNLGIGEIGGDDNWRKQQILELEVYSKRLELVQHEIKVALEELRSAGGG
ncbi:probable transcription factor At5g28040 [Abrus precatorius]|uniref:Probable transcription factor At5g28040 n=1 Tax=Abrus precatorius TaxID=3816 RepID=A0A8B8MGA3_ABRPR|nr:probable transcription factor At5g28040 [Abrus precatorius]